MKQFKFLIAGALLISPLMAQQPENQYSALEQKIDTINVKLNQIQSQLTQIQSSLSTIESKVGQVQKVDTWFQQDSPPTTAASTPSQSYSSSNTSVTQPSDDASQWIIHEPPGNNQ